MDKININAVDATQSREGAVEALLGVDINGEVRRTNITKLDTYSKSEIDSKDGAIKQYTDLQISALIGGATPASLDTISKLAAALQEDDNAFSAINKGLSTKYGPDNKPTAAALDVLPRVNPIANGTMTAERYVTAGGGTIYNQQGTTTWMTNKAISDPTHKGIGVSDTEPKFWDGTTSKPIWHDGNAPVYAKRWPTLVEIKAQPAGSYAAASHTHPWTQITGVPAQATRWPTASEAGAAAASHTHPWAQVTGVPVYATRWPNKAEVGLSNVGNFTSAKDVTVNTNALRDENGDLVARQFHGTHVGDGSNLTNLPWAQVTGVPTTATRWPTLTEIKAQPAGSYAAASHTHPWAQITGVPVQATRWPTPAEVGAQPAGSYAAASHTHAYAPLTGAGTSGTWPISIAGQAATASSATKLAIARTIGGANFDGTADITPLRLRFQDTRATEFTPASVRTDLQVTFQNGDSNGMGAASADYYSMLHVPQYNDNSGGWGSQIAFTKDGKVRHRKGTSDTTWSPWAVFYTNQNKPTAAEIGAQPAGSYAAASHTHPWAQVTGAPAYATRWPTLIEIGAQAAGSYAAASHTHPWAQISGIPAQATRWPNSTEVGLGNVPNTVHSANPDVNTVAVRDSAADINARLFRSNYTFESSMAGGLAFRNSTTDNYIRFCNNPDAIRGWLAAAPASHTHPWSQITGAPAQATRWPTWDEISGKPAEASLWINLFKTTAGSCVREYSLPPQMLNHLVGGGMVKVRVFLNQSNTATGVRRCIECYIDGSDGWQNGQINLDLEWSGYSYLNIRNNSAGFAANIRNRILSQYPNIQRVDMRLL